MSHPFLLPMAAHVALAALLYAALTLARAPKVWGIGRRADGSNPFAAIEPRLSANLSNQFEWPLFFHVACLLLPSASGPHFGSPGLSSPAACCIPRCRFSPPTCACAGWCSH